ncbi:MAG: sigma-54 dependent transcriptional regulator [Kofleriaceae bacterium]
MSGSVLVVDDDDDAAQLMSEGLRKRGISARAVASGAAALEYLRDNPCDVVVTDIDMAGMTGIELCDQLKLANRDVLAIVVTGSSELPTAVAAIRAGAFDFVTKPLKVDALSIAVARALEHLGLRRELQRLREHAAEPGPSGIAGTSAAIRQTIDMIDRVAESDVTVLITGESGTGKELVARALHDQSSRRAQPFVAINCAAMPAPLLESELFGHVRGAFTDAKEARHGLFVQAKGGTVFLDEIGEMPAEMQVKLLRVLQERTVRPVGGDTELPVKARVITATNRNLEHEVEDKRFREDLYYRINVVPIPVPPLRERQDDILMLAQLFLTRIAKRMNKQVRGISEAAARRLLDYDWPGNVRELENCMERAVAICRLDEITIEDLPATLVDVLPEGAMMTALSPDELITIDEMTRRYVRKVLALVNGNKTHAAKVLGIDRRSLYRRLGGGDAEK